MLALSTSATRFAALSGVNSGLAYLGRQSLPVYVSHIIFAAGARVLMVHAGITAPLILFVLGLCVGIAGPLVLERVTRPIPLLFKPPWELDRASRVRGPIRI